MKRLAVAMIAVAVAGCSTTTKIPTVWKSPELTKPIRFERLLVAVQSKDQSVRRRAEDLIVARLPNATPSYSVLTEADSRDADAAKAKVVAAGFDGVVICRLVSADTETTYAEGGTWWEPAVYGNVWGYWGYGWHQVYGPSYVIQDTVVTLETNVYSVTDGKLLWASRSETINPMSLGDLLESVIDATVRRMKKEGVA